MLALQTQSRCRRTAVGSRWAPTETTTTRARCGRSSGTVRRGFSSEVTSTARPLATEPAAQYRCRQTVPGSRWVPPTVMPAAQQAMSGCLSGAAERGSSKETTSTARPLATSLASRCRCLRTAPGSRWARKRMMAPASTQGTPGSTWIRHWP